jgi:hypothetical protein
MSKCTALPLLALLLASSTGCHWFQKRPQLEPTPILFQQAPTLEQLTTAVNNNTQKVVTLQSRDARMAIAGVPMVDVNLLYEQPRRLRLRAGTGITGQELDLGSNDELFWFWARRNPEPALLFARHDQFARSPNRSLIPIEPNWVIDAIGLPYFDPNLRHEGPFPRAGGLIEVRSGIPSPAGEGTKITVINQQYAWVVNQQVFDAGGRMVAAANAAEHEYYPHAGVSLPRKVAIELPPAQMSFVVETKGYAVNAALGDSAALFALPQDQFPNVPLVDLADPRLAPPPQQPVQRALPQNYPATGELQPRIRGLR